MDNLDKIENGTADTAGAENENKAAAVPEKFKDVKTLLKAYRDLEAEFTRRSQRLKELECGNKVSAPLDAEEKKPSRNSEELIRNALSDREVCDAVIGEYLKSISQAGAVPLTAGGGGISAPRTAPATVKEAGKLAMEFFRK